MGENKGVAPGRLRRALKVALYTPRTPLARKILGVTTVLWGC